MAKKRVEIPSAVAAEVLFRADRTCCVCRDSPKPVQLHHIDDDPSNSSIENLAVLCLDCHRETQIRGGFDRKLDADQVLLYREDWDRAVAGRRAQTDATAGSAPSVTPGIDLATSLAEIHREKGEWLELALLYNSVGNEELRDKYVDAAIAEGIEEAELIFLRGLQGRPELVPEKVAERVLARLQEEGHWHARAGILVSLGRYREAAEDYVRSVLESLEQGRPFPAAYYLRELVERGLITHLYIDALQEAADRDDLWWQVRPLQDLGWDSELEALLLGHAEDIENSGNLDLKQLLAAARGDYKAFVGYAKEEARRGG